MSPRNRPILRPQLQIFFRRIRRSRVRALTTCAELEDFLVRAVEDAHADTTEDAPPDRIPSGPALRARRSRAARPDSAR